MKTDSTTTGTAETPPAFTFDAWVSFKARTVQADDGLRVEFAVHIPSEMNSVLITKPDQFYITCKYRVRKGFQWGQLGRHAEVRVTAWIETGKRGGQWLHCTDVQIIKGVQIEKPAPLPKFMRKEVNAVKALAMEEKQAKASLKPAKVSQKREILGQLSLML